MNIPLPPIEYLLGSSERALENIVIARYAKAANLKKEIRKLVEECVGSYAEAVLAEWLIKFGPELAALEPKAKEEQRAESPELKKFVYAHWRSERRHQRRRSG